MLCQDDVFPCHGYCRLLPGAIAAPPALEIPPPRENDDAENRLNEPALESELAQLLVLIRPPPAGTPPPVAPW